MSCIWKEWIYCCYIQTILQHGNSYVHKKNQPLRVPTSLWFWRSLGSDYGCWLWLTSAKSINICLYRRLWYLQVVQTHKLTLTLQRETRHAVQKVSCNTTTEIPQCALFTMKISCKIDAPGFELPTEVKINMHGNFKIKICKVEICHRSEDNHYDDAQIHSTSENTMQSLHF